MSTPRSRQNSRHNHKGELARKGKSAADMTTGRDDPRSDKSLQVRGLKDQHGRKWLAVQKENKVAYGPLDTLLTSPSHFYKRIAEQDLVITQTKTKNRVTSEAERSKYDEEVYIVDRLGWHGDIYVWPGRELPVKLNGLRVVDALSGSGSRWVASGSYQEWQKGMRRLANGQALPTFVIACAFAAPLQRLFPEIADNIGFELFWDTSVGKSKLMMLASSAYGGSAYLNNWSTTVNALEDTMAASGDALLLLNEAHLFLDGSRDKDQEMCHAVFKLAEGTDKARFNAPAPTRDHRFLFVSSTNKPAAEVAKRMDAKTAEAVQVRLITISADAGSGFGIFDKVPRGCATSAEAIIQLDQLTRQHHGWAAKEFIRRLEGKLRDPVSREALRRQLRGFLDTFVRRARIPNDDGQAHRIAQKFALVWAAGRLAQRWQILPVDDASRAVRKVYQRYRTTVASTMSQARKSAIEEVRAYAERHQVQLHDLDSGSYPSLTDVEFASAPGFSRTQHGATWLIISPQRWTSEFGSRSKELLDALHQNGFLWATEGKQRQMKVRNSKPKDRVYCIKIT